jgi:hypothetical protein
VTTCCEALIAFLIGASRASTFYSHTGRPSIDPELMIRMLVIAGRRPAAQSIDENRGGV